MSEKEKRTLGIACVLIVLAALLPIVDQGYWLSIGVSIAMYTVLATSWALFSGPTNLISLASAAFFGVGMYVVAGGIDLMPYWILVLLAGLAGAILAALVGIATLRIAGVYFVIFTLGMAELVRQIVVWGQATLGTQAGLYVLTDFTEELIFWLLLGLAAIVFFIGWWVGRAARLRAAHYRQRRNGGHSFGHQHRPRQGHAVCDFQYLRGNHRRPGGAALRLRGTDNRVLAIYILPGGHHGAVGRRAPALGAAGGGYSVHSVVGGHKFQLPHPDHLAARHIIFADRLFYSARLCRFDRRYGRPQEAGSWIA